MMTNGRGTSRRARSYVETLIMVACLAAVCAFQAEAAPLVSETEAMKDLSQFEYLPPLSLERQGSISKEPSLTAISKFRSIMGMNVTGNTNVEMAYPKILRRCGVPDAVESEEGNRAKRYALIGLSWPRKNLTYKISKYSRKLDRSDVDREIARAFAIWSEHTDLTFTRKRGEVDIEIRFESGDHDDGYPFGGSSDLVLAHAFYPQSDSAVHFNDDKDFTIDSENGVNLIWVATHEIGHTLGLHHSYVRSAVMTPFPASFDPNVRLDSDDIAGIQALYGPKTRRY